MSGRGLLLLGFLLIAAVGAAAVTTGAANVPEAKIEQFAGAIAFAEGFWDQSGSVNSASRPARNNNPGDLEINGDAGMDGPYAIFSTLQAGWNALYNMLRIDFSGKSTIYSPSDTISDYAWKYTATNPDAWSEAVAQYLGVTINTKISDWLVT